MRLWHECLLPKLPRQQLLGQHRECCALRGAGWGRKHSVVNYVFTHDPEYLYVYHCRVMDEMKSRGYHPDEIWYNASYREKLLDMTLIFGIPYYQYDILDKQFLGKEIKKCIMDMLLK